MDDITRRRFLRKASVGAAAAGAVAVGGTGVFTALTSAEAASPPLLASSDTPGVEGSGVIAHVDDAKAGRISIYVGTRKIEYTNRDLAQQLYRAAQ